MSILGQQILFIIKAIVMLLLIALYICNPQKGDKFLGVPKART